MATIKTTFWEDNPFGTSIDEKISKYKTDLSNIESWLSWVDTELWDKKSKLIKEQNAQMNADVAKYQAETDRLNQEYKTNLASRRTQSDSIVKDREAAAWLQANIAAAAAPEAWRLSVWQIQSINKDITNQFSASLAEAKKDNINFQSSLDDKLATFWLSIIDKKKILSELSKTLKEEETAPLLDALANTAANKKELINTLWTTIKNISQQKIDEATNQSLRSDRVENEQKAFELMSWPQRERYIRDSFAATWNVLSPWQQNELIQKWVSWAISWSEIDNIMKNMKDKAEQSKTIQLQAAAWDKTHAEQALLETWIWDSWVPTFTKWQAPKDNTTTTTKTNTDFNSWDIMWIPWVTSTWTVSAKTTTATPYKKWNTTYVSKAAYDTLKKYESQLLALKNSNPTKFNTAMNTIKEKFIIK